MKRLSLALALLASLTVVHRAAAQQPVAAPAEAATTAAELSFYQQQLERYEEPKSAVRRKAEFRAAQRQARIAAMKWYGYSNARPTVNPTPWGAQFSPRWGSASQRPFSWYGGPTIVLPGTGYVR